SAEGVDLPLVGGEHAKQFGEAGAHLLVPRFGVRYLHREFEIARPRVVSVRTVGSLDHEIDRTCDPEEVIRPERGAFGALDESPDRVGLGPEVVIVQAYPLGTRVLRLRCISGDHTSGRRRNRRIVDVGVSVLRWIDHAASSEDGRPNARSSASPASSRPASRSSDTGAGLPDSLQGVGMSASIISAARFASAQDGSTKGSTGAAKDSLAAITERRNCRTTSAKNRR